MMNAEFIIYHSAFCIPHFMNGLLVVNKPVGPTSHDIVFKIRKWSGERRAGHTGTLDPLASGVLVICLGTATRISEYLLGSDKRYRALVQLGRTTATYDAEGQTLEQKNVAVTIEQIESALEKFRGTISQTPPAYSAVQVDGRRAYDRARRGEQVELEPRAVTIHTLNVMEWTPPDLTLDVLCSAGTYIRSLAHDLGGALGCGGHLAGLARTGAGRYTLADAHALDEIQSAFNERRSGQLILATDHALADWPAVHLDASGADRITHGNPVPMEEKLLVVATRVVVAGCASIAAANTLLGRAYNPSGQLIAIVEADPATKQWKPKKVLAAQ